MHSLMARPWFKNKVGINESLERSVYVLQSSVLLHLTMHLWQTLPFILFKVPVGLCEYAAIIISFLGWIFVLLSTFMIDHFELFGLKQCLHIPVSNQFQEKL